MKTKNIFSSKNKNTTSIGHGLKVFDLPNSFAQKNYLELIKEYFKDVDNEKSSFHQKIIKIIPESIGEQFKYPKDTKNSIKKLLNWTRNEFKIPASTTAEITLIYNMRCASTIIKSPDYSIAGRFIINYHDNEMYRMKSPIMVAKNDITNFGVNNFDQYLKKDTVVIMGPGQLCYYNIKTNPGIWIHLKNPDGSSRKILKPRNYARLTAIVDIIINKEYARVLINSCKELGKDRISMITTKIINNMTVKYRAEIEQKNQKIKSMLLDL